MLKRIFNKKKNIAIISILGLVLIIGGTYAMVNWTSDNYSVAIRSSCMNINYTKGQDIDKNLGVIDENLYISGNTITMNSAMAFSSVNIELDDACSDINGLATVEINITGLSDELKIDGKYFGGLKYVVVEYDPNNYSELSIEELNGQTFNIVGKGIIYNTGTIDAYTSYIEHGEEKNYLVIFYAEMVHFKNDFVNILIDGSISARVEQFIETPISNFTYSTSNGNVVITKYNGSDTVVNLAPTYIINGIEYNTVVSGSVFLGKTLLREVNFADGITAVDGNAGSMFTGCSNLIKVSGLPYNIVNLSYAFQNCSSLVDAPVIGNSVQNMYYTFYGCTSLVDAPIIGNSVQNINYTFYECSKLVNAPIIPNSVQNMNYTFYKCTSLVDAPIIPNSVQNMNYTFSDCSKLVNAPEIPNSVIVMVGTFYGCRSLVNAPIIPNSVQNINYTFYECSKLVNAPEIPNSVTSMNYTFDGCTSLVNAPEIPNSVTSMTGTFRYCWSLTGTTIRINSRNVRRTSGSSYHPFYSTRWAITVEVPSGSTTYTYINNNKPANVTISTFTS